MFFYQGDFVGLLFFWCFCCVNCWCNKIIYVIDVDIICFFFGVFDLNFMMAVEVNVVIVIFGVVEFNVEFEVIKFLSGDQVVVFFGIYYDFVNYFELIVFWDDLVVYVFGE